LAAGWKNFGKIKVLRNMVLVNRYTYKYTPKSLIGFLFVLFYITN
jgi:hypothetical protein